MRNNPNIISRCRRNISDLYINTIPTDYKSYNLGK